MKKPKAKNQKLRAPKILVSGSLVFDNISNIYGNITDSINIKNGKIGKQNLMFTGSEEEVFFGGCAGNIVYGLGLLKQRSIVVSVIGNDFKNYKKHLENMGGDLRVYEDVIGKTANFSSLSDKKGEQVGIFRPNVYGKHIENISLGRLVKSSDWDEISIGIFSPGTGKSIVNQMKEFSKKKKNATVIFDPGQTLLPTFNKNLLTKAFSISTIAIFNDIEANIVHNHFGFDLKKIFSLGTKYVIETKGAEGSVLYELKNGKIQKNFVKTIRVKKVVDPTGAGDAFRSGLVSGIISGKSLVDSMKIGSKLGAECVKTRGGQTYFI